MSKMIYLVALSTALGMAVVCQGAVLRRTGYEVEDLQNQLAELEAQATTYRAHLSRLRNPQRITGLVAWLGLDLQEPTAQVEVVFAELDETGQRPSAPADEPVIDGNADELSVAAAPRF